MFRLIILAIFTSCLLNSCTLIIYFKKLQNPKRAPSYPKLTKEYEHLGKLSPLRQKFDVTYYDLDLFLQPSKKTVEGWVEIRALAIDDLGSSINTFT